MAKASVGLSWDIELAIWDLAVKYRIGKTDKYRYIVTFPLETVAL